MAGGSPAGLTAPAAQDFVFLGGAVYDCVPTAGAEHLRCVLALMRATVRLDLVERLAAEVKIMQPHFQLAMCTAGGLAAP